MALDGITTASIVCELEKELLGGRVDKIYQPEKDEIIISVRSIGNNYKLLLSANPSHPRLHLTSQSKENPMQAPLFCMVLRKHISGGKITKIVQPNFERIVQIHIESFNELGDMSTKKLIIEIMGKHSNIILVNENDIILDACKHISHDKSSVREVLPNKLYVLPPAQGKQSPMLLEKQSFYDLIEKSKGIKLQEIIYKNYSGISPFAATEICVRSKVAPDMYGEQISTHEKESIYNCFNNLVKSIKDGNFEYNIFFDAKNKPFEFSAIVVTHFSEYEKKHFNMISQLLEYYYSERDTIFRISQKTADIRKIINSNIERCVKKKELYQRTLKSIENRNALKICGELLTAHIYSIEKGMTKFTTQNYYDENNSEITIRLDPSLTPAENAQRYFKKYNKEKRTFAALQEQIVQNNEELNYLEGVLSSLTTCATHINEADILDIREELAESGFVKKKKAQKGQKPKKSKPMHFVSSEGFDIYVGKNNKQNDELTLKFADSNDIWFHTKDIAGSHVIVKINGKTPSDVTLNEAANLAAYYSKARESSNVPVDYTVRKNVKKPSGAKPGMVIYENYKTAYITPKQELLL